MSRFTLNGIFASGPAGKTGLMRCLAGTSSACDLAALSGVWTVETALPRKSQPA